MTRQEFLKALCCPTCKGDLRLHTNNTELHCDRCVFTFPIVDGIPVLFPCNVASEMKHLFARYWDSEDKAQLYDTHVEGGESIFGVYNHQSEVFGLTSFYEPDKLDLVLDAGCGNGRFLETLPSESISIGIDASLNLLRIARRKGRGHFHVCGELEHLPFREGTFSTVISCRVLQHLKQQEQAVKELCRVTTNKGSVILELYNTWNLKTLYKNIRMSKYRKLLNLPFRMLFRSMSPFDAWGLSYDNYNSWFEVKRWLLKNNMHGIHGRGVGFGYHKYLFAPFYIDAVLAKRCPELLRSYYAKSFSVEKAIGHYFPFRYFMEKFVMKATKNAPELNRGLGRKVFSRIDDHLKSSFLWNWEALKEVGREKHGGGFILRENRFHIVEAVEWLKRAQDSTPDRGVSRGYSVGWNPFFKATGWQPSYPETTGYLIPTMFDCAKYLQDTSLRTRAIEMADWEIDVQMKNGAVMGGTIDRVPSPAVFNTGQVILGWVAAYQETKDTKYLDASKRAGDYLLKVQNADGSWIKGNSEFANATTTTYNSRVGWALVLLGQCCADSRYLEGGEKNVRFSLSQQNQNGWFRNNCLTDSTAPLLHTISYAIEGIWGAGEALQHTEFLRGAAWSAEVLLETLREDGSVPGRLDSEWKGAVEWSCLTGDAQLAGIWLRLYAREKDRRYLDGARRLLTFLKASQNCVTQNEGLRGGIKGSFPFDGEYGRFEVLNWATKFYVDALLLDEQVGALADKRSVKQ